MIEFINSANDGIGPLHGENIIILSLICIPIGLILAFVNIWQLEVKYRRMGLEYSDFLFLFLAWVIPIIFLLIYIFEWAGRTLK